MRQIYVQKTLRNALLFCKFSIYFLHMNFAHFSVFFCRKICRKLYGNFLYFSSFSVMIFMKLCAGMGKAGSRCKCGDPDRDCTGNTRLCSGKKSLDCVGGSGYDIKLKIGLFYLVGPDGPPKKRLSYVNFSRK